MGSKYKLNSFVMTDQNGIGKLVAQDGEYAEVEFYHSVANRPKVKMPIRLIRSHKIERQTRCYYFSPEKERWVMGRVKQKDNQEYEVEFPDGVSKYIDERHLYVRSNRPIDDPMEVLEERGHETAFFSLKREKFVQTLHKQREIARGMTGLLSSNIMLLPHQVEVVRRVLEDPVPRYLLADEVGLGKTIEAGAILRQYLIDHPEAEALLIIPAFLLEQWQSEMKQKFYVDQFGSRVHWLTSDQIDQVGKLKLDRLGMVIIDEAHTLAVNAYASSEQVRADYRVLEYLSQKTEGLLLLSATPVLNNEHGFLAMLHLLDPDYYQLDDLEDFKKRVEKRQEIGHLLLSFKEDAKAFVLKRSLSKLIQHFPDDQLLQGMVEELQNSLNEADAEPESKVDLIRKIRVHLSDTYRLHRRLLRNRRESVGDVLNYSRNEYENDSKFISLEPDLDERTPTLESLLDEWRQAAWASEQEAWEDSFDQTDLSRIFQMFFEASGSSLSLFRELVTARLKGEASDVVVDEWTSAELNSLLGTDLFEGEKGILEQMIDLLKFPSEDGDRLVLIQGLVKGMRARAIKRKEKLPKIVVFTTYRSASLEIVKALRAAFGSAVVAGYHRGMGQADVEQQVEHFRTNEQCSVLVCDRSGEEGRNLQFADVIVHFDLPLSPNRLEQRAGRVDRIGRSTPFRTYILSGPDETDSSLHYAWVEFLKDGLQVFDSSIAMYQFFIEEQMPKYMAKFFVEGIEGLANSFEEVKRQLQDERVKIEEQDTLDTIDAREQQASNFFETLKAYDQQYEEIQRNTESWICDALKVGRRRVGQNDFYYVAELGTLAPLPYVQILTKTLKQPHTYDRSVAVGTKDCTLYRIGEPFVDLLAKYIRWDDRGQAYAFWRQVKQWGIDNEREEFVFKLHYVIEGDTCEAERVLEANRALGKDTQALQRRLDRYFPAHYQVVYVDLDGRPIVDPELLELVEPSFNKREFGGTDLNLIKDRLSYFEQFSEEGWRESCQLVRSESERLLRASDEMQQKCEQHAEVAARELALAQTQLALRASREKPAKAHQRDRDQLDLEFERNLNEALVKGIRNPKVRLDSVGLIVLSGKPRP